MHEKASIKGAATIAKTVAANGLLMLMEGMSMMLKLLFFMWIDTSDRSVYRKVGSGNLDSCYNKIGFFPASGGANCIVAPPPKMVWLMKRR